jgi:hypothetical protein
VVPKNVVPSCNFCSVTSVKVLPSFEIVIRRVHKLPTLENLPFKLTLAVLFPGERVLSCVNSVLFAIEVDGLH